MDEFVEDANVLNYVVVLPVDLMIFHVLLHISNESKISFHIFVYFFFLLGNKLYFAYLCILSSGKRK